MLYHPKGTEELSALLEQFIGNHSERFGTKIELSELERKLTDKLTEVKEKHFNGVFGTMPPADIANLIRLTKELQNPKPALIKEEYVKPQSSQNRKLKKIEVK